MAKKMTWEFGTPQCNKYYVMEKGSNFYDMYHCMPTGTKIHVQYYHTRNSSIGPYVCVG
jgi:hypothetical protein